MKSQIVESREMPLLLVPLWWFLQFIAALIAICGLGFVVLALLSFAIEMSDGYWDLMLGGEPVRTATQKVLFTAVGAALVLLGGGFFWLRQRGYRKGAVLFFAITLGLCLLLGMTAGIGSISGGPFKASWSVKW